MPRITDADRVSAWVNGDPVTNRINGDVGSVKWTNSRHSDGKRFVRVRVHGGGEVWENGNWVIGKGTLQRTCYECGEPFRTNDGGATFCLCCARHHRPRYEADAVSSTHAHNRLFGNATPYRGPDPRPDVCDACGHLWKYHTVGGMCQGTAEGVECYCVLFPPEPAGFETPF